jgi:hypothetical protein
MLSDSCYKQAKILTKLALRFSGDYAWIEKAQAHACDIAMMLEEGARKLYLAADALKEYEFKNDSSSSDSNSFDT